MRLGNKYIVSFGLVLLVSACEDKWDDHNRLNDGVLEESVSSRIAADAELSTFNEYLVATGYDVLLRSSKVFTVWAPVNSALEGISESITGDADKLKQFVGNHISYQAYYTNTEEESLRIRMLNGKYNMYLKSETSLGGATITTGNLSCKNGVLHKLDERLEPAQNIWEFLNTTAEAPGMTAYLLSLTEEVFVDSLADQIGINPDTGKPIYDTLSGLVERNRFLVKANDVSDEDSLYTLFLLTDDAFAAEIDKVEGYFQDTIPAGTADLSAWNVVKDLSVRGAYYGGSLPAELYSSDSVRIPVVDAAIVATYTLSNGVVYILNSCDFALGDKIRPIIIEGEYPTGFSHDRRSYVFYRERSWASNDMDIEARNHATANFTIFYKARHVNSAKYEIYWRAVNDFEGSFWQKVILDSLGGDQVTDHEVVPDTFDEVLLGERTVEHYGDLTLLLQSANTSSSRWNPLVLDYLKLVPVLE